MHRQGICFWTNWWRAAAKANELHSGPKGPLWDITCPNGKVHFVRIQGVETVRIQLGETVRQIVFLLTDRYVLLVRQF